MFDETIVSIFFRIINLAALLALSGYIFKKYFLADVHADIISEREREVILEENIRDLEQRGKKLEHDAVAQEQLCQKLLSKAASWHAVFDRDRERRRNEEHLVYTIAEERAQRQARALEREKAFKTIVPHALELAQKRLEKTYSGQERGGAFIEDIVAHMRQG